MGLGGRRGSATFRCDGCITAKQNEFAGYFRVGRLIGQGLVVGGEMDGWLLENSTGDSRLIVTTTNAFGQYYLRRGFFVTGGAGLARIQRAEDVTQSGTGLTYTATQTDTGLGFHAGAGYEFQFAPHAAFIPFATRFGTNGIEFPDTGPFNAYVFVLGVGLSLN